jgi:hypothetical protein
LSEASTQTRIAGQLFSLLASGGTVEQAVIAFPAFKPQIETAFEWMKSQAHGTGAEIEHHVQNWRELVCRKCEAIKNQEFDLAAEVRQKEIALLRSLGLEAPRVGYVEIEEEMQRLSAILHECQR